MILAIENVEQPFWLNKPNAFQYSNNYSSIDTIYTRFERDSKQRNKFTLRIHCFEIHFITSVHCNHLCRNDWAPTLCRLNTLYAAHSMSHSILCIQFDSSAKWKSNMTSKNIAENKKKRQVAEEFLTEYLISRVWQWFTNHQRINPNRP